MRGSTTSSHRPLYSTGTPGRQTTSPLPSSGSHFSFCSLLPKSWIGAARGFRRREIRTNRVLPQAEPREDVRRHVKRVRRVGRDLRVALRGRERQRRELRIVEAVNQVMRDPRVIR